MSCVIIDIIKKIFSMYMVIAPPKPSPLKRTIKKLDPMGSCSQTFKPFEGQVVDNYLFVELILDI